MSDAMINSVPSLDVPAASPARRRTRSGLFFPVLVLSGAMLGQAWFGYPRGVAAAEIKPAEVKVTTPIYRIGGSPFKSGERWVIDFEWSGIPVGRFEIEIRETADEAASKTSLGADGHADRPGLDVAVTGSSNSLISLLYRYRLDAKGRVFTDPFAPHSFHAEEEENRRFKLTDVEFDKDRNVHAVRRKGDKVVEHDFAAPNTYDIMSSVFLIMSIDHKVGDEYFVDTLTGNSRYLITVLVEGREQIEVAGEQVEAFRLLLGSFELTNPEDDNEKKHKETRLWVSAERPKRLLRARSKTFVGSMYGTLTAIEPLPAVPSIRAPADASGNAQNKPEGSAQLAASSDLH